MAHCKLTPIQAKLLEITNRNGRRITTTELDDPPWDSRRSSSWTTFVPEEIYQLWNDMTLDARLVAYIHAVNVRNGLNSFDL